MRLEAMPANTTAIPKLCTAGIVTWFVWHYNCLHNVLASARHMLRLAQLDIQSSWQDVKHTLLLLFTQGWCVKTLQDINQGSFVCEYAGEYVSGAEAAQRLADYDQQKRGHALLVRVLSVVTQALSTKWYSCC
eukprot:GHRR01017679.1.p1 GENE.GHRR01017679.1~~GHRR01017679.1.p1  ORF type:complete len:133 (+),score=30.60 GHRR01017679.1:1760-2158(+)